MSDRLKELLKLDSIRKKLGSRSEESYYLRIAMKNYVVLLDGSLKDRQKAERLGVPYNNFLKQMRALRKNELTDPEEVKRYVEKLRL